MNNRLKQFFIRIADLVALSIIVYTLIFLILQSETLNSLFFFLSESFKLLPKPIGFLILGCIGFSLPIFLKKHNCYNINHTLINDARNPPIYLVPIFVIFPSIFIHSELQELLHTSAIFAFTVGLFLCLCMMLINNKKEENHTEKSKISFDMNTWLEQEVPISNKNYDFLGFHAYVERITTLLEDNSKNKSHQIAIRGDFGTGKSSLCRLLEEKLASVKSKNFIFCYVDGWGREDSSFAGQILEIVIEKLSEHTDCSSLIGVPESYINALNGSGLNSLATVTQLFSPTQKSDPEKHLRKIDAILMAIDSHMAIVLEDFDRGPKPDNIIGELGSLLERTKDLKNTHFFLCIKRDRSTIIDKICTHVEDLHEIPNEPSSRLITEFLAFIEKEYPPKLLVTTATNYHFMPGINPLIKTPRALKIALRRTATAWLNLRGEIDLIDLLHFNLLRFCQPDAFLFFLDNFNKLSSMRDVPAQNREETKKLLDIELDKLNLTHYEINGVKLLINCIFKDPYHVLNMDSFFHSQLSTHERITSTRTMQRIVNRDNNSYLNRAISESIPNNEPKDQETLKWICSYTSDNIHNCLSKIDDIKQYETHLTNLIKWICSVEELTANHMPKIADVIVKQSIQLFPEHEPPFIDITNVKRNTNFTGKAYPLIDQIKNLFGKRDYTGSSIYHNVQKKIIITLIEWNAALAIHLADQFIPAGPDIQSYPKDILETLETHFNRAEYKTLLDKIDSKKHIRSLTTLCNLYAITHIQNNQYTPYGSDEINRFHSYLTNSGFEITKNIIPSFVFHLDNYHYENKNPILENFNKSELKEMIMSFELPEPIPHTQEEYIYNLVNKWQLKIDSYITT